MAEEKKENEVNIRRSDSPSSADTELITRGGKRIRVTEEEFAVMLEKAGGFKSRLAKQLGISVSAVCHRIKRSKYLQEQCKTIEETVLDMAEAGLLKAAQNGEPWAITFILKCKGRKRGWVERQDVSITGADELPPPIVIPINNPVFIAEETERQRKEFADVIDVAMGEFTDGGSAANTDEGGASAAEQTETTPEAPVTASSIEDEQTHAPGEKTPQDANSGAVANPKQDQRPLRPSEVLAMRRAQAEKKAEDRPNGGQQAPKRFVATAKGFPIYRNN